MCCRAWLGLQLLGNNGGGNCFEKAIEQKRTRPQKDLVGKVEKVKDKDLLFSATA